MTQGLVQLQEAPGQGGIPGELQTHPRVLVHLQPERPSAISRSSGDLQAEPRWVGANPEGGSALLVSLQHTHTHTHTHTHSLHRGAQPEHVVPVQSKMLQSSHCGPGSINPTSIHEDEGSIPGLAQRVKDPALP